MSSFNHHKDYALPFSLTIYNLGDGLSDLEAARQADLVFATGHLLDLLGTYSIERSAFSEIYDLQCHIRLL